MLRYAKTGLVAAALTASALTFTAGCAEKQDCAEAFDEYMSDDYGLDTNDPDYDRMYEAAEESTDCQ